MDKNAAYAMAASMVSRILDRCVGDGVMLDTLAQRYPPQDAIEILDQVRVISVELKIAAVMNKSMENSRN